VRARKGFFGKAATTPLLQTVPLMHQLLENQEEAVQNDPTFDFRRIVSPTTTPVQVLLSNDWKMGVALLLPVRDPSWNVSMCALCSIGGY
jgi:hypothetical protein